MTEPFDLSQYDTDKSDRYLANYREAFAALFDQEIALLELGIRSGGSLALWHDLFPHGRIAGLDVKPVQERDSERVTRYQGRQQDTALLDRIAEEIAPEGFDIVIDDASHVAHYARTTFWHVFQRHLKSGGIYAIEDWGTGYWPSWPDGGRYKGRQQRVVRRLRSAIYGGSEFLSGALARWEPVSRRLPQVSPRAVGLLGLARYASHEHGMVGFVKELIDQAALADITNPEHGIPPARSSPIRKIQVSAGQAFVIKE
jgi:SAM-dependent methyltransferase